MRVKIGDRFEHEMDMAYKDNGAEGRHYIKALVEVTSVNDWNAEYKVVSILEERGRPSFAVGQVFTGGGFAVRFVDGPHSSFKRISTPAVEVKQ